MYGIPAFERECRKQGIHPLFGMEVSVSWQEREVQFILLARDNTGYKQLMKLSSLLSGREAVDRETFRSLTTHCFVIAYGEGGYFDTELLEENYEGVRARIAEMKEAFGTFDIALSYQETSLWRMKNAMLRRISASMGIRTVALNRIY